ncbi:MULTISPECIES: hypothetical protein [Bacillus]|uniref:Polymerase beta nucleotidyltransferase domain-containing protein n=1 Tax=Bacillus pseudomycoides TaxID=64104 RepID=A0A1Y3MC02_9BACI|nr:MULTISPECIES: hypothetical protein [Bacillus cereus group]EOP49141.1 hypothetical protein IIW_03593 [Bacillus cereus VD136]EOP64302.1 hypothetical protein KOW_02321 [Bacillus cereus VDM006]EOQ01491.1 hypothetical protein KOY_05296 [Bacillus cereus VDM021]OOG90201.1 hypothetical protein BTH41_03423 [Bacillus mycoides]MDF2086203.1 hypothetical protein [Bacillus pseudomycoides]
MRQREDILRVIQAYLLKVSFVKVAYIFGPQVRKEVTDQCSHHIAIETKNASHKQFQWLCFELIEELEGRVKFDVVHLNSLSNLQLKKCILQEGKLFVQRI